MVGRRTLIAVGFALVGSFANVQADDGGVPAYKLSMCQGCHGIQGYRTAYPEVYPVPLLGGQHADYIAVALRAYREGTRKHPSMQAIAQGLSDQNIADLAAYYAQSE